MSDNAEQGIQSKASDGFLSALYRLVSRTVLAHSFRRSNALLPAQVARLFLSASLRKLRSVLNTWRRAALRDSEARLSRHYAAASATRCLRRIAHAALDRAWRAWRSRGALRETRARSIEKLARSVVHHRMYPAWRAWRARVERAKLLRRGATKGISRLERR